MMHREAVWIRRVLEGFPAPLTCVLSIGSGTERFRTEVQPWIGREVFEPLEARQVRVVHHELAPGAGIDIAGDLNDPDVLDALESVGADLVLCLNVLEHVPDRTGLAGRLERIPIQGGHLLVTVPRLFPYHPDPLDTLYRPRPDELLELFQHLDPVDRGEIACESLLGYWMRTPGKTASLKNFVGTLRRPSSTQSEAAAPPGPSVLDGVAVKARMALRSTTLSYALMRRSV